MEQHRIQTGVSSMEINIIIFAVILTIGYFYFTYLLFYSEDKLSEIIADPEVYGKPIVPFLKTIPERTDPEKKRAILWFYLTLALPLVWGLGLFLKSDFNVIVVLFYIFLNYHGTRYIWEEQKND